MLARGHDVRALVRPGSETRLPPGCIAVRGNALEAASYASQVAPADTFVHLVGVSHPAPWKEEQFKQVDLGSVRASVAAAKEGSVHHIIYLSVAQPAPVMRSYVAIRAECEALISATGIPATFVRPWYVLGPGHRWPYLLIPFYAMAERFPGVRDTARRLGLVTLRQMIATLVWAAENPPETIRILDVEAIRRGGSAQAGPSASYAARTTGAP